MGMIFLGSCGEVIDDPDEFQDAVRPFLEMERRDQRSGPCEDDHIMVAPLIEDAERFERGYFDPDAIDYFIADLLLGPGSLYPQNLHDGPPGLPCGGILTNKRG